MSLFAVFGLGPTELAVIALLGLLLFGRKLPSMGSYLGQSIRSFKQGMSGIEDNLESVAAAPSGSSTPPRRVVGVPQFNEVPAN